MTSKIGDNAVAAATIADGSVFEATFQTASTLDIDAWVTRSGDATWFGFLGGRGFS